MRSIIIALLLLAGAAVASRSAPAAAPAPFDGAWMSCETYRGARICSYKLLVQREQRFCGVRRYFATNAYYEQRFVGTVRANVAHIEKICGDPGSETDTHCAGRAPDDAARVGWEPSDEKLFQCRGRLLSAKGDEPTDCLGVKRHVGLPKVRSLGGEGPHPDDRTWLASCAADRE